MRHIVLSFLFAFTLGACETTPSDRGVFAPGVDPKGQEVDGLIVGERLMENGEYELALEAFHRAAAKHGLGPEVLSAMGVANFRLGRTDQAIDLFEKALISEPNWPGLLNNLGTALMAKGDYSQAALIFQKAVALDNGENDSIRNNLRLALEKKNESLYSQQKNDENDQGDVILTQDRDERFP